MSELFAVATAARRAGRRLPRRVPRQLQPDAIRVSYFRALQAVLRRAQRLVEQRLVPELPGLVASAGLVHDAVSHGGYAQKIAELMDTIGRGFFEEFTNSRLRALAATFGERVSTFQRQQLAQQFGSTLGIDIAQSEPNLVPKLEAWAGQNASLIKSVPARYFGEIESRTLEALRTGERAEDIAADYQARYGVSESRAMLIARDQVGKLTGQLNKARQGALGVKKFVWRTVGDERVRDEHEALDGKVFDWDDPPSEGIPGEPIACRCGAEPVLDDVFAALRGEGGASNDPLSPPAADGPETASTWHGPGAGNGPPPPWLMEREAPGTVIEDTVRKMAFDTKQAVRTSHYLAAQGNDVTALHRENVEGGWPDAAVNGEQVEFAEADIQARRMGARTLRRKIEKKAEKAQARNLVVDIRSSGATAREARIALNLARTKELRFVRIIGDGFDLTSRRPGAH